MPPKSGSLGSPATPLCHVEQASETLDQTADDDSWDEDTWDDEESTWLKNEKIDSPLPTQKSSASFSVSESASSALAPSSDRPACAASSANFWRDLCEAPPRQEPLVDLGKNPEKFTGYNGSTVWTEIYGFAREADREVSRNGKGDKKETGFLETLISGWHASVSAHIAVNGFAEPSNILSRTAISDLKQKTLPYISNLEFTYLVLLRALFKAKPFLYSLDYSLPELPEENSRANALIRHLLDSSAMALCTKLFSSIDETGLGEALPVAVKKIWKKIHGAVRCKVKCQRCRLHGLMAVRGLGAAVKLLFLEESEISNGVSREEVVALVGLLGGLSDSLAWARQAAIAGEEPIDPSNDPYDLIVIGGGLAGMAAAVSAADRGARVLLVEKAQSLGGNSAKASSGINGVSKASIDSTELFYSDTVRSAGSSGDRKLEKILTYESEAALTWLQTRFGLQLDEKEILGGHSAPRTWRPRDGLVGAEIVAATSRELMKKVDVLLATEVTGLVVTVEMDQSSPGSTLVESVQGVKIKKQSSQYSTIMGSSVLIASGGFGASADALARYRPDLAAFPTTLSALTTGGPIFLTESIGADLIDMEYVQLHPTGFIDPADPRAKTKTLAAEILRGVGGLLIDPVTCDRFVNELGTRKHVVEQMLARSGEGTRQGRITDQRGAQLASDLSAEEHPAFFYLLLTEEMLLKAPQHMAMYVRKKLLKRVTGAELFSEYISRDVIQDYERGSNDGKQIRPGTPMNVSDDGVWYIGQVTPVVHYTMGGIRVDEVGRVLRRSDASGPRKEDNEETRLQGDTLGDDSLQKQQKLISGLYAAGEASGGVHGENRLGGNSLLECVVFGRRVGGQVPVGGRASSGSQGHGHKPDSHGSLDDTSSRNPAHDSNSPQCLVKISGNTYDLTGYAPQHPGGPDSILRACGKDATEEFLEVHTIGILAAAGFKPLYRNLEL